MGHYFVHNHCPHCCSYNVYQNDTTDEFTAPGWKSISIYCVDCEYTERSLVCMESMEEEEV